MVSTAPEKADGNVVSLTFLETSNNRDSTSPATLLVHGLDSSSHTWRGLLEDLGSSGFGALAVDNRGCGKSPLGDATQFSPDALVDDIYTVVTSHPLFTSPSGITKPFVFVGHSMGGRIGMSFAAKYPELIAALVIEDMDIVTRGMSMSYVQSKDRTATVAFDRELSGITTSEEVVAAFVKEGYPSSVVEKWLSEGRVEENQDTFYSQVNPAFRLLCYETIFDTSHGEDTWKKLAAFENDKSFPIHLMISDPTMTVCFEDSITLMKSLIEDSSSPTRLTIHRYPGATHSIHNSAAQKFTADLKDIIEKS